MPRPEVRDLVGFVCKIFIVVCRVVHEGDILHLQTEGPRDAVCQGDGYVDHAELEGHLHLLILHTTLAGQDELAPGDLDILPVGTASGVQRIAPPIVPEYVEVPLDLDVDEVLPSVAPEAEGEVGPDGPVQQQLPGKGPPPG